VTSSTQHKGNGALVQKRIVSTQYCELAAVVGSNPGADVYILIFELAAEPAPGAVPDFGFLADAGRPYAFALPRDVELSACTVVASSTLDTYTAAAGTPVTIQALLAA